MYTPEELTTTIKKLLEGRKANSKIAKSDTYNDVNLKEYFKKFFASVWEDLLATGIKTKEGNDLKIHKSKLLQSIQNAVYFSSLEGYESLFYITIKDKIRFFNGKTILYNENFEGDVSNAFIQVRQTDAFNIGDKEWLLFYFDFKNKKWSLNKMSEQPSKDIKKLTTRTKLSDADKILLGIDETEGKFTDQPVLIFKNNARANSDTEGLTDFIGVVDYLVNQVPETYDYERIKFELNLMYNSELDPVEEDEKLRNSRTTAKNNQDERFSTATGIIQGNSTIESLDRVIERWFEILFKLSKTPSVSSGLTGKNQKGSAEVVGADPLATAYAFKKLEFFNKQLSNWVLENKKLKDLIGDKFELEISPLLELKQRFISEGVISSQEQVNNTTLKTSDNKENNAN